MIYDLLPPYPEYKDSGVPWLIAVPSHWMILRAKNIFNIIDVRSKTGKEELLTVSSADGVRLRSSKKVTMFEAASYVGHKLCWPGDLVINSLWAWQTGLGFSKYHGLISSAYSVYRLTPQWSEHWRFYDYLLRSAAYDREFRVRSKGVWTSRLQLLDSEFMDMPIVIPPPDEQAAIVRFLDAAEARIRRYIRAKQKLIKLLNEQKQVIIQQAVTRGLDPDVPMKDSEIEGVGMIPQHWEQSRLKFVASHIVDCLHSTPSYVPDGQFPAIRTADVEIGNVNTENAKRLDYAQYLTWIVRLQPKEGDILYSREGERYGIAALVPPDVELCISQRMMVFRIKTEYCSGFIMWQLNAPHVYAQASQDIGGATSPHVNIETIKNYWLIAPPVDEQEQIDKHIVREHQKLNEAIGIAKDEMDLIREYRTRLIADVVTGKVDVRGAAFDMPEEIDEGDLLNVDEDELLGKDVLDLEAED